MIDERRLGQLERGLAEMGGTHTLPDILAGIEEGRYQSFAEGDTWAVTSILDTPQKRILEIFLVVGDMPDAEKLHDLVEDYARAHGCQLMRTIARAGWKRWAKPRGWKNNHIVYLKEL